MVILQGEHVGANADGQVAGVHLVDLRVFADQMQHIDQVPEQQEVGPGELICNPGIKRRDSNF